MAARGREDRLLWEGPTTPLSRLDDDLVLEERTVDPEVIARQLAELDAIFAGWPRVGGVVDPATDDAWDADEWRRHQRDAYGN